MTPRNTDRSRWLLLAVVLCGACATPPPEPLESGALAQSVAARVEATPEVLAEAHALAGAPPLGLELPESLGIMDARTDVFWHAHALAWNAGVRRARRAWRAAARDAEGAGYPARSGVTWQNEDLDDASDMNQVHATVDLLGLLGLGAAPAEREVAVRLAEHASGRLEEAAWRAVFAVDVARVRRMGARHRLNRLEGHLAEASEDLRRLRILAGRGRLPEGLLGRVEAVAAAVGRTASEFAAEEARSHEGLERASGLSLREGEIDRPTFDVPALFVASRPEPAQVPSVQELLDTVPDLRTVRLAYAVSEARLRAAAAAWWPRLRVGPRFRIRPDDFLTGGAVSFDLPWPSKVEADIEAALERRANARETVEDALVTTLAAVEARRKELLVARASRARDVTPLAEGSREAWRAARARFSVLESADVVDMWVDAFQLRARGIIASVEAAERVLVAELAYREAAGLRPGLERGGER